MICDRVFYGKTDDLDEPFHGVPLVNLKHPVHPVAVQPCRIDHGSADGFRLVGDIFAVVVFPGISRLHVLVVGFRQDMDNRSRSRQVCGFLDSAERLDLGEAVFFRAIGL